MTCFKKLDAINDGLCVKNEAGELLDAIAYNMHNVFKRTIVKDGDISIKFVCRGGSKERLDFETSRDRDRAFSYLVDFKEQPVN